MANLNQLNSDRRARQNRYFSASFKKKIVKDYENNLISVAEIHRQYNVSRSSIYKWIYKYSLHLKRQTKQVIELKSDTRKIAHLKARLKELEQLVGQKQIQLEFNQKMIELIEQEYGIDVKKKFGSKPFPGTGKTETNTDSK